MKFFELKLIALLLLTIVNSNIKSQTANTALEYMQEMQLLSEDLKDETWQYLKAVTKGKGARKIDKKRQELIEEVSLKRSELRGKQSFTEDGIYKKAVLEYFDMTYTVLKEDYDKILDMEDIAEQSYDLMEAYILAKELAGKKMDEPFDKLKEGQKAFAQANNITLVEGESDKKSEKIKKAGNALEYYNDVYLIFFKSYKQEAYILDAMQRADVSSLEQNINTMVDFNKEGLTKLDELENYNGDASLKLAANKVFDYFNMEATKHYPSMVNYFVAKDNFEKIQKALEAKKKSKRTKDDIEQFNKAVETFNAEVNKYNETNKITNKGRADILAFWNKEVDNFFDQHTN